MCFKVAGRSLALESKVTLNYVVEAIGYTGAMEDLTMVVSYVDIDGVTQNVTLSNPVPYGTSTTRYTFAFDSLLAAELRAVLSAAVYSGDTQLSNSTIYSIDSYGVGKTGELGDLCKALMAYSDTALAYFQS